MGLDDLSVRFSGWSVQAIHTNAIVACIRPLLWLLRHSLHCYAAGSSHIPAVNLKLVMVDT